MKPPRTYAFDYLRATTKAGQKQALYGCPEEWRELVKSHIKIAKARQAC